LSGRDSLNHIKVLEPEDVLFRAPVSEHCGELKAFLEGKKVLLTGAGGSIGSELSRQIAHCKPENLILFERHEESLYKINMELSSLSSSCPSKVTPIIGDILDENRVVEVMDKFRPDIVFHAAAYKHVPLMEDHPDEAFKVNVIGTKLIAEKSKYFGVERFILISTDKSVNPVNVMGLTKKIAEETITALSEDKEVRWSDNEEKIKDTNSDVYLHNSTFPTKYITVRFGNVLESSGSVVPLFKEQIKRGGPVTVTHPEITRYFMTIPEAVNLVLQAANNGNGGEVFVLDMGKPIKILDLAKRMINLYGYKPGVDIDISFIGLRPGEKLYEELFNPYEKTEKTSHSKINMAISNRRTNESILETVKKSEFLRKDQNFEYIFNKFSQHFPSSKDSRL
jgi:FlaA1/EpsC-like NDP-sugar epimerase